MATLRLILIVSTALTALTSVTCVSVPLDKFHTLVNDRCFNETYDRKPLTLGQNFPVGLSVENLIALIEKIEVKLPQLSAQQIVLLILKRFHIDGIQITGQSNMQTPVEIHHTLITGEIMESPAGSAVGAVDFPEDALTEDEKCQLFFTISHTVNETAGWDEDPTHRYTQAVNIARGPTRPDGKSLNQNTNTKPKYNTSISVQSGFLKPSQNKSVQPIQKPQPILSQPVIEQPIVSQPVIDRPTETKPVLTQPVIFQPVRTPDTDDQTVRKESESNKSQRVKRENILGRIVERSVGQQVTKTRRPREKGVASFRNEKTTAIAMNRVLLGTAVGLLLPFGATRSVRDLINQLSPKVPTDNIPDGSIDVLLAVTLSDLLGIDAGSGLTLPANGVMFGATGLWNSTACQTRYKLTSNGTLGTLAELRGGLDGWNIGRKLPTILQQNPKISLSQILRQYYSQKGLASDSGVCQRSYGLVGELQNKVKNEAENYIRVWNGAFYQGSYFDNQLTGFVAESWAQFYRELNKAGTDKPSEERDFCNPMVGTDIKTAPCESTSDVFFLLDNMPAPAVGSTGVFTPDGTNQGRDEEVEMITQVAKALNLGRSAGSISVLVNAQGQPNPGLVDENNVQLNPPLYAIAYNSTSSQCVSCRAAWYDNRQVSITDRPVMMELLNRTLMEFELKKADLAAIPSKSVVWFEYGNLKDPPTDRENKRRYEDFKWWLRYGHRDVTFFMASINKENVKDLLKKDEDWIPVGQGTDAAYQKGKDLVDKICQTPQIFQHNECRVKASENKVYEGYITPGYKQYWAMFPEYFIKSYSVDLKFKAEKSRIKVCFDRFPNPERDERRCDEAKDDGGELTFNVRDPCKGKSFENCPGFYFTVSLNTQSANLAIGNNNCIDARCRSPDQMKWTFTHTGVSCNGSAQLLSNWGFQLICFILFLAVLRINGKRD